MEFYMVGGAVRDEIMGVPSKDIDFTVVIEPGEIVHGTDPFVYMHQRLTTMGFRIFQAKPEFLTIRAQFPPKERKITDNKALDTFAFAHHGLTADFVLARKEGEYTDGRRPDKVEPGTLMDDLGRRDFCMNAIAKSVDGQIIDPFHGQGDIHTRLIRAVGNAEDRLREDALRGLRAMRFAITKDFFIHRDIVEVLRSDEFAETLKTVSKERQREEVEKMLATDTVRAMKMFDQLHKVREVVFSDGLRLSATMKA